MGALELEDHIRISSNNALNAYYLFAARGNHWLPINKVIFMIADEALHVNSFFLHLIIMLFLTLVLLLLPRSIGPSTLGLVILDKVIRKWLKPLRLIRGSSTSLMIYPHHRGVSRPSHLLVTLI